jgi:hypothetical protein
MKIVQYYAVCEEHRMALNSDGTCPKCRDANGQSFVLDMQSYFLVPLGKPIEKGKSNG